MSAATDLDIPAAPTQAPRLVAVDDGLAQIKLIGEGPEGRQIKQKMPSAIRSASGGGMVDLSGDLVGMYQTEEGSRFVCSADLSGEETRSPDFHVSEIDRVLVRHALVEAGFGGDRITLLTALPVDEYFRAGEVNRERIDRKMANLKRGVSIMGGSAQMPQIVDSRVGCQAIAAYFDHTLRDDGRPSGNELPGEAAIVDIGGSTTDVAVVISGKSIDQAASGALRRGVLDVHAAFLEGLTKELGFTPRLSPAAMDRAIRTGRISAFREERDVSAILQAAIQDVGGQIIRDVERKIGNAAMMDAVVFVGGGAGLFADVVRHWRGVTIPDDPEFANARGLLKYAKARG